MGKKDERIKDLIEFLKLKNGASIPELAEMLNVSEMTVRRDLNSLKEQGIILDIPGAAVLNTEYLAIGERTNDYFLSEASTVNMKEKERIGRYAASLIQPDDCIIIDNGSTVEFMTDHIDKNIKITILTCNLNILNKICYNKNISIIFGGGYYHPDTTLFESPENIKLIQNTRATKVFSSAAGISEKMGVTCMYNYEVGIKQAIIESGAERVLLADSSKFGVIKPCFLTDVDCFDRIISDKKLSEEWVKLLRDKGIKLDLV